MFDYSENFTTTINFTSHSGQAFLLTPFETWLRIAIGLGLGSLSVLMHGLIALSIFKNNHMESRFNVFIFFLSIARVLYALGHAIASMYHVLRIKRLAPLSMSLLGCHTIQMFVLLPPTLELIFLLLLVTDRAVALGFPLLYRNLGPKQAIKICIGAFVVWLLIRFFPSYTDVSVSKIIQCVNIFAPLEPKFALFWQYGDMILSLAILVPYAYLLCAVRRRLKQGGENGSLADASLKRSIKVLPFLTLQLIVHCLCVVSSRAMKLAAAYVGTAANEQRMIAYYGLVAAVDIFVNAVIFFWKYPRIWYESVRMLCGRVITNRLAECKILRLTPTAPETLIGPTTKIGMTNVNLAVTNCGGVSMANPD